MFRGQTKARFPGDLVDVPGSSGATEQPAIDVRPLDIRESKQASSSSVGNYRNGRAGVHVRKGKLLAGDSGRKIAEVIDLQGAIYQRVAGGARGLCVWPFPLPCTRLAPFSSCGAWTFPHVREEKTKSSKCEKKGTRVWRDERVEKSGCWQI